MVAVGGPEFDHTIVKVDVKLKSRYCGKVQNIISKGLSMSTRIMRNNERERLQLPSI